MTTRRLFSSSASAGYHGFYPWGKAQAGFDEMGTVITWRMSRRSRLLAKADNKWYHGLCPWGSIQEGSETVVSTSTGEGFEIA